VTIIDRIGRFTADPIGKFEATMTDCDEATMAAFYHGNMEELMGITL
jgi:hypothetical protein